MTTNRVNYKPKRDSEGNNVITELSARKYHREFLSDLARADVVNIDLSNRHMTSEGGKAIASFIKSTIADLVVVVNLAGIVVVGGVNVEQDSINMLAHFSKALKDSPVFALNMSNDHIGKAIKHFECILSKKTLQRLKIENAGLEAKAMDTLIGYLGVCKRRLTHISFNNNRKLGAEGAKAIGSFIGDCPRLVHIEVGGIAPGAEGTRAITQGILDLLEKDAELRWLNMKDCKLGPRDGNNRQKFEKIVSHRRLVNLHFVNIMNSGLSEADQRRLKNYLRENNANLHNRDIHLGKDDDDDQVQELESQFVEISMRG